MKWSKAILGILLLAALAAGCGNNNNNNGGGGSGSNVTVIISPSIATVVPNASLQLTAQVSGVGGVSIVANSGAVRAAGVVTITTTSAHNFVQGQQVSISGVVNNSFNGVFTIATVPTSTTFTYAQAGADATSGGGTALSNAVTWFVNDVQGGNSTVGTITTAGVYTAPAALPPPTTLTIVSGTGAKRSSNTVTITTTADHGLLPGQVVIIAGVTDASFNGTFTVSNVVTAREFIFAQAGADATSGGGTVTATAVTIKATSVADPKSNGLAKINIDSGITVSLSPGSVTLSTSDTFQFSATVTAPAGVSTAINYEVNSIAGGNSTLGTVSATGLYTAPTTVPSPATVILKAVAQADPTRSGSATIILATAATPTLTSLSPATAPEGAVFQDVYLTGTNFRSSTVVLVNGNSVPAVFVSPTLLRVRLASSLLVAGTLNIDVQPQGGAPVGALPLNIVPVRPALAGASPDSVAQGSATLDVNFNGGFLSPSVTTEFNGQTQPSTAISSRQRTVTLGAAQLTTPGLFPIAARNSTATPSLAVANLAVQPTAAPAVSATLGVGTTPSAVAVNPATGLAMVVNRGSNDAHIVHLAGGTVSGPFAVGTAPTGVAIDFLNDVAYVANNGSNNLTLLNASTGAFIANITGFGTFKPVSVAVNPLTRMGLVALESTNIAAVIDLDSNSIISAAGTNNGASPQVVIEPFLNWATVTPGGSGEVTIVDLNRRSTFSIAATGASRNGNIVSITTTVPHSLSVGQAVLISGVADASFNGLFSVSTITSSTTFTYTQSGANATSGGGSVNSTANAATVQLGASVRGVSLNSETARLFFADTSTGALRIMSLFDQSVSSVTIEGGNVATAVNPLTDLGVSVNPNTDEASVIDLRTPLRLHRIGVGTDPRAVAIDPGSNMAIVTNEGSNNVSILNLGAIRSPHITQVSLRSTFTSANPVNITVLGFGFVAGAEVRLDETPLGTTTFVNSRMLTASIPASFLAAARRYALDVENPGGARTNVQDFAVYQAIAVGTAPRGVAVDSERNLAVVANSGSGNISIVDLTSGTVTATVTTGTTPEAVALLPRMGRALVSNSGSNSVSFVDLLAAPPAKIFDNPVGTTPLGIAINEQTGTAVVANSGAATFSYFDAGATAVPLTNTFTTQVQPTALVFDITRDMVLVANAASNTLQLVRFTAGTPNLSGSVPGVQLPSGAIFDPISDRFIALSSLTNNAAIVNPDTAQSTALRLGINPTSIAYNANTSTLVTVNSSSRTLTVVDLIDRRVRAILPVGSSTPRFAIAIHQYTNMAVVSDEANNRIILVPLPR